MKKEIYVKGPGAGRDAALRAVRAAGVEIALIADITPTRTMAQGLRKRGGYKNINAKNSNDK